LLSDHSPLLGSVPEGQATGEEIDLSLTDAIERGLRSNLGVLLSGHGRTAAEGERRQALSELLPNLSAGLSETIQQTNLAALGFPGFPGVPQIIGPFSVFDARAYANQSLLNLPALHRLDSASEDLKAADFTYQNAKDLVVLGVVGLYLQALAGKGRVEAAQAQFETAQALYMQATSFKEAGVVPAIEVLRAQVEMQSEQQRLIYLQNRFEKEKLKLGRAIGLSPAQRFRMTDDAPYRPLPPITVDQAIERAYAGRPDYKSAESRLRSASLARKAAESQRLPTADVGFNYGTIGRRPGSTHGTFTLAANVDVPIFEGGRISGEVMEAEALVRERQNQLDNLHAQIRYDVQNAFLDIRSSENQVKVAANTIDLAHQQLEQARDRFTAGVATNIEVVQAQAALATANENYISSLFGYNLAKAELARAIGGAEKIVLDYLRGETK
jgi:outer membrane protein TolC